MRFDVLTLFPDLFQGYFSQSILKLALERGLVEIHLWNLRDWAKGHNRKSAVPAAGPKEMQREMARLRRENESLQARCDV